MKTSNNTLGASNLSAKERSALDYYGTDPKSTRALLDHELFNSKIWEPCCGHHLISDVLEEYGYEVRKSDITEYEGYEHEILDFLSDENRSIWNGDIVTNPPYNLTTDCVLKCLSLLRPGNKLAMFLRLQYLEGQERYEKIYSENPPKKIYVFVNRQTSSKDDDFSAGSAVAYCWYVWQKGYRGNLEIEFIKTK